MERRKAQTRSQRPCPSCQTPFWPRRGAKGTFDKYCSRKCYYAAVAATNPTVLVQCANCSATVKRSRKFMGRRAFCSKRCQALGNRGANNPVYRGTRDPNRGSEWLRLAAAIRERDGHKCRRCLKTKEEDGRAFSVDHLIPWRCFDDKKAANDPSNLATLCRSCHAHKTGTVEPRLLRGDRLTFDLFRKSLHITDTESISVSAAAIAAVLAWRDRPRHRPRPTHCPRGHEYNAENAFIRKDNGCSVCRICMRDGARTRAVAKKSSKAAA